jgi:hypothetical protein
MSEPSNHLGGVTWYIVTAGEGVDIPGFVFNRDDAPYLIGQLHNKEIAVFDRAAILELMILWQEADKEMRTHP